MQLIRNWKDDGTMKMILTDKIGEYDLRVTEETVTVSREYVRGEKLCIDILQMSRGQWHSVVGKTNKLLDDFDKIGRMEYE